jgi:hypothetical protein
VLCGADPELDEPGLDEDEEPEEGELLPEALPPGDDAAPLPDVLSLALLLPLLELLSWLPEAEELPGLLEVLPDL